MKDEFFSQKEKRHNELCARCTHPSKKCLICGKAEDNLVNDHSAEIDFLKTLISKANYKKFYTKGEMEIMVKENVARYEETKRDLKLCMSSTSELNL